MSGEGKMACVRTVSNTAAVESYNVEQASGIELRVAGLGPQVKYLNNIVEQYHRAVKRMTRPMLGFKSFWSAAITLAGIELMHMIRKGQLNGVDGVPNRVILGVPQKWAYIMRTQMFRFSSWLTLFCFINTIARGDRHEERF